MKARVENDRPCAREFLLLLIMNDPIHERRVEPALADWTRRLAQGDEAAWGWFHQRYYLPLLRYAAHRAGNPSHASDIVQQGYLRVARHIRPFAEEENFWNWLCCVVRCAAVDHGRHSTRRLVLMEKFAHWRTSQSLDEVQPLTAASATSALLQEALGKLAEDEATLLRRKYCEGWSTDDLAVELGTTPKAVENRLARLRERLREIILHIQ